jgi:hypothetical protein
MTTFARMASDRSASAAEGSQISTKDEAPMPLQLLRWAGAVVMVAVLALSAARSDATTTSPTVDAKDAAAPQHVTAEGTSSKIVAAKAEGFAEANKKQPAEKDTAKAQANQIDAATEFHPLTDF